MRVVLLDWPVPFVCFPGQRESLRCNKRSRRGASSFSKLLLIGEIEYGIYNNLLLLSYHTQNQAGNLKNNFAAIDMHDNSTKISVVLSENTKSFMTDSFFMYKNFLILLKEKNGLIIYKLE